MVIFGILLYNQFGQDQKAAYKKDRSLSRCGKCTEINGHFLSRIKDLKKDWNAFIYKNKIDLKAQSVFASYLTHKLEMKLFSSSR